MINVLETDSFRDLRYRLRTLPVPELANEWPDRQFVALTDADGWRWNISCHYRGLGLSQAELLQIYRVLAAESLVTTFILTQRNAACQRIETSANERLRHLLLEAMADGKMFATVGISHLTTSRQHWQQPAVTAIFDELRNGYVLNGTIPWATAATRSQIIVTGGTCPDNRQILAAVPTDRPGVCVQPPVAMMALSSSQTAAITLDQVFVSIDEILHGPIAKVMSHANGSGAGSLGTSALAIGAADGNLTRFREEAESRPDLLRFLLPLEAELALLRNELTQVSENLSAVNAQTSEDLRRRANVLVIRSAQAWLAASKGAGFILGHPAERAVRESMFFLVWSCPQPVVDATLRELIDCH